MFVGVAFILLLVISYDAVEMIQEFPGRAECESLSFHGDVVYVGSYGRIMQWNVVTDAVVRLGGYASLI